MVNSVSAATNALSKYEAHQELIGISREHHQGVNVTQAEFDKMDKGGHLDEWKGEYGFSFSDLDLNRSGRISEHSDGSRHRVEHEGTSSGRSGNSSSDNSRNTSRDDSSDTVSDASSELNSAESPTRISGDVVVVQFGWSDTSQSSTQSALSAAGIGSGSYKMSDSGADKGVGIAVVTPEQAAKFEAKYNGSKTFAYTHNAVGGVDSINDLDIDFDIGSTRNTINFGGGAYGALMTDDPANKTSGSGVQGRNTGSDSFWSVNGGDSGSAKMYEQKNAPNGKQFVSMDVNIK